MKPARAMIPGEILCSLFAISLAWSGGGFWPFEPGLLYKILKATDGRNMLWAICLGVPAITLMTLSIREWICGLSWTPHQVRVSSCFRGKMVLAMGLCWIYSLYLLGFHANGANSLLLQTIIASMYCGWSYVENRRVQREVRKKNGVTQPSAS